MVDFNSLYPIVLDLTDAEYSQSSTSIGCCNFGSIDFGNLMGGMCSYGRYTSTFHQEPSVTKSPAPLVPRRTNSTESRKKGIVRRRSPEEDEGDSWKPDKREDVIAGKGQEIAKRVQTFDNTYVRTRQMNRCTLSTVWETIHRRTGVRYATKIIDRRPLTAEEDEDVYREAAILNILTDKTGIVGFKEFFDEPTYFYIVFEYAEGGNLMTKIKVDKQPYTEKQAKEMAKFLLEGVDTMHGRHVCHRNLKPDNILLESADDPYRVLIADFGLARLVDRNKDLTEQCGSPSYVAPEVLRGDPYDTQADLWSVGVILYFCMAGYLPFRDRSKRGLFKKILKGDFVFDSREWGDVSRTCKSFLMQLLQVDPIKRMTALQALEHPWIITPSLTDDDESTEEDYVPKSKKKDKARKHIRRVFFKLSRNRQESIPSKVEEDGGSLCSRTMSSGSFA